MQQELLPLEGLTAIASPIAPVRRAPSSRARSATGALILDALQLAIDFTRTQKLQKIGQHGGNEPPLVYVDLPPTRGDCRGPGICTKFSCRHNLALRVKESGAIKVDGGGPGTTLRIGGRAGPRRIDRVVDAIIAKADKLGTLCSLDVAESGALTIPEVAEYLGVTEEVVRQIFLDATHELQIAEARERRAERRQLANPKQAPMVQIRKKT